MNKCKAKTEVYSRVVGYYRPIETWNKGKKEEFRKRKAYNLKNKNIEPETKKEGQEN